MGKVLVVKNADFSDIKIRQINIELSKIWVDVTDNWKEKHPIKKGFWSYNRGGFTSSESYRTIDFIPFDEGIYRITINGAVCAIREFASTSNTWALEGYQSKIDISSNITVNTQELHQKYIDGVATHWAINIGDGKVDLSTIDNMIVKVEKLIN